MNTSRALRIAVTSDIHWEVSRTAAERRAFIGALAETLTAAEPDVVLLAGDAGNGPRSVREALSHLAVGRLANLFVPGNHDVWLTDRERDDGVDTSFAALDALAEACAATGFRYLPGDPVVVGGVGFAGSCGWYDYTFRSPEVPANFADYRAKAWGGSQNQDGWYVRWEERGSRLDDGEVADRMLAQLGADLARLGLDEDGGGPPTVAATHMLPFRELASYRGPSDWGWDFNSAFFGSEGLGRLYDGLPAVRAIVAGHTHTPFAVRDGWEREIVVSPMGYAGGPEFPAGLAERVTVLLAGDGFIVREEASTEG